MALTLTWWHLDLSDNTAHWLTSLPLMNGIISLLVFENASSICQTAFQHENPNAHWHQTASPRESALQKPMAIFSNTSGIFWTKFGILITLTEDFHFGDDASSRTIELCLYWKWNNALACYTSKNWFLEDELTAIFFSCTLTSFLTFSIQFFHNFSLFLLLLGVHQKFYQP